LHLENYT